MHKHVTAHFPDRASAEAAHAALETANIYAHDVHLREEAGGVAVVAYVQPEEVERAVEILKGRRAPNDTTGLEEVEPSRTATTHMEGGPDAPWSREEKLRPDGSSTEQHGDRGRT